MDYYDPIAVVGGDGNVAERYGYSAFGVASILAPDYSARSASSFKWEFLFHGQFEDEETGWQDYSYRYYDPEMGRWLSRDPIEERGGVNLYSMIANNPINSTDFLGFAGTAPKKCCGGKKISARSGCCAGKPYNRKNYAAWKEK